LFCELQIILIPNQQLHNNDLLTHINNSNNINENTKNNSNNDNYNNNNDNIGLHDNTTEH